MVAAFVNPVDFAKLVAQKPLNPAEQKFVDCMAKGEQCILSETCPSPDDENVPIIRADLIRFFACGGSQCARIVGGSIELQGACVPDALKLADTNVQFALSLSLCHFVGEVKTERIQCPALFLDGSYLAEGLKGEGMQIKGDLCLRQKTGTNEIPYPFIAEGEVQLAGATIGGSLDCHFGWFCQPGKTAIFADGITVGGGLYLMSGCFEGDVSLSGVHTGMLDCREAVFTGEINVALAEIKNSIVLLELAAGSGTFNFAHTQAARVVCDDTICGKFTFDLNGFMYRELVVSGNIKPILASWLNDRPEGSRFYLQPFEQAAKVLASMGRDKDARDVLFTMNQRITEEHGFPKWRKLRQKAWKSARTKGQWLLKKTIGYNILRQTGRIILASWRWFLEKTTGYNYSLWRMARTSAAIIIAGWIIFGAANERGYIVPHQTVVLTKPDYQQIVRNEKAHVDKCAAPKRPRLRPTEAAECLFPGYPRFDALWFSMDIFLPTSPLHQELYWYPHPRADDAFWRYFLLGWYWFQVISGWVLTSIFALTITGIMQRSQASWSGK